MADQFTVLVTGSTVLSKAEVWPDGDAPEKPTARDVALVMCEAGRSEVINDWCLIEDLGVEIYADTTYAQPFKASRVKAVSA